MRTDQVIVEKKNNKPCTRMKLSVRKKLTSVRSTRAISAKTIRSRSLRRICQMSILCFQMIIIIGLTQIASGVYKHLCEWSRFIFHFHNARLRYTFLFKTNFNLVSPKTFSQNIECFLPVDKIVFPWGIPCCYFRHFSFDLLKMSHATTPSARE